MEPNNTESSPLKNRVNLAIAIVAVAALILLGVWWWQKSQKTETLPAAQIGEEKPAGLGGQLYESVKNPVEGKVPETNPFKTETNPLKDVYKNPFE